MELRLRIEWGSTRRLIICRRSDVGDVEGLKQPRLSPCLGVAYAAVAWSIRLTAGNNGDAYAPNSLSSVPSMARPTKAGASRR